MTWLRNILELNKSDLRNEIKELQEKEYNLVEIGLDKDDEVALGERSIPFLLAPKGRVLVERQWMMLNYNTDGWIRTIKLGEPQYEIRNKNGGLFAWIRLA